jgi:hypothetical protein
VTRPLFVFGTLLDPDVRMAVISRGTDGIPASLAGFRRCTVAGESFPMLVPDPASVVSGLLIEGLTELERQRVQFFEGVRQRLQPHLVRAGVCSVEALVCFSMPDLGPDLRPAVGPDATADWDFVVWQRTHKSDYLADTQSYMAMFGHQTVEVALRFWEERQVVHRLRFDTAEPSRSTA